MRRRRFLEIVSLGVLGAAGCGRTQSAIMPAGVDERAPQSDTPPAPHLSPKRNRVVLVRSKEWLKSPTVEKLRQGLVAAILHLTGAASAAEGWRSLFKPEENVAVKVNCLAGPALCSSPALVGALIEELKAAGHPAQRLWVYDRHAAELEECGFHEALKQTGAKVVGTDEVGYEQDVTVAGSVGTQFSMIISGWADAIINVPVAKDHDLAGISGALKNHLGSISNPNKLHYPDISLAIADLSTAPVIKDKQRLVVYDLLRVCYDGGPGFKPRTTVNYGAIILAADPVAADAVVVGIIDKLRESAGLPSLWKRRASPDHIKIAADPDHQLGCADLDKIDLAEVEV